MDIDRTYNLKCEILYFSFTYTARSIACVSHLVAEVTANRKQVAYNTGKKSAIKFYVNLTT